MIPVNLAGNSYNILVEAGSFGGAAATLSPFLNNGRLFIITDNNVAEVALEHLVHQLKSAGCQPFHKIVAAGEQTKSWCVLEEICDWLLKAGIERSDTVAALGGGVIGDLTGFAAAIVKRGCNFVQVPTTLLSQVDSSVGGKTAINTAAGKNLVGRFNQPRFVLIDPLLLNSLPDRDLRAGYAEVLKYGLINDAEFFSWCEQNFVKIFARDPETLTYAITRSVRSKAKIVAEDEKETTGTRALLNLGHTFGHALEAESGYCDKLVHGEAVAAGMALAFDYSVRRGHCHLADAERVRTHLRNAGLPHSLKTAGVEASGQTLVKHMLHDKKMDSGNLPFLLATGIGETFVAHDVDLTDVAKFLDGKN